MGEGKKDAMVGNGRCERGEREQVPQSELGAYAIV
jgi:hypothetical protein